MTVAANSRQSEVDAYFDSVAGWWRDVYEAPTVEGAIYRRRRDRVLEWIVALALPAGSSVLEVGGGAGLVAVELAGAGHRVLAVDSSREMVRQMAERARAAGVADRLEVAEADVQRLDAPDARFDLVVAMGVLPWVPDPVAALTEMARVARPGAAVVVTSDNRRRLAHLVDPRLTPSLRPLRHAARRALSRPGWVSPEPPGRLARMYSRPELVAMLRVGRLRPERIATIGFGPLTLAGRPLLPERGGARLEQALQRAADRGTPLLRAAGSHHLVLARPAS